MGKPIYYSDKFLNSSLEKLKEIISVKFSERQPLCFLHSFGCQQNVSDGEKIKEMLSRAGYGFTDATENADLIIGCYKPVVEVVKGINLVDDPNVQYLNEVMIPKTVPYLDWIWPTEVNAAVCQIICKPVCISINCHFVARRLNSIAKSLCYISNLS